MPHTVAQFVWYGALLLTTGYAFIHGRKVEKVTAAVLLLSCATTILLLHDAHWRHVKTGVVVVDLCFLSFLLWIALASDRWWPLWAAAFQAVAVMIVLLPAVSLRIRPLAYFANSVGWDYLTLAALAVGTLLECENKPSEGTSTYAYRSQDEA